MSQFAPVERRRVADQVAVALRDAIVAGQYPAGDRLPPERELAVQFGVNRSSVREALQRLSAWGLVEIRQGGGAQVNDLLAAAGLQVLPWLLAPAGEVDADLVRDLLEVRVGLLGFTGELAATHATPDQVRRLEEVTEALAGAVGRDQIQQLDYAFFEEVVAASGNRVLALVASIIGRAYDENLGLFTELYPEQRLPTELHAAAVRAIGAGDPAAARAALEAYGLTGLALFAAAHGIEE